MDMRILPRYSKESIFTCIDNIKNEIENKYNVTIEYTMIQSTESKPTSADSAIVKDLSAAVSEIYAVKPRVIGIGGGTMAAYLRNIGIDCAVWTKAQNSLHQPNEYVLLDNMLGDAKVMALLAALPIQQAL
jgi:succinyl-diaminopimelate desuccinylase